MTTQTLSCAGEELTLLAERAVFWPRAATLFMADLHFGKDATFRSAGIAIPVGTLAKDLARLEQVILATRAQQLVILGDFFHARPGRTADTLALITAWRQRHATLDIVLVPGNHDRHAGEPPSEWGIKIAGDQFLLPPFVCRHEPLAATTLAQRTSGEGYILAGHVHPVIALREVGGAGLRLPCFFFGAKQAILPAFGSFTGGYTVRTSLQDRVFVITPQGVCTV